MKETAHDAAEIGVNVQAGDSRRGSFGTSSTMLLGAAVIWSITMLAATTVTESRAVERRDAPPGVRQVEGAMRRDNRSAMSDEGWLSVAEGGVAWPFEFHDGFNDNTIDPATFLVHEFGGMRVHETGPFAYVMFNRLLPGNFALSHASMEIWPWGADLREDFRLRWVYHMAIGRFWFIANPNLRVFHGMALAVEGEWPESMTGVACGLLQDANLLRLVLITYENGVETDIRSVPVPNRRGAVNIHWDAANDRLTVRRGLVSVHRSGLKAMWEAGGADFNVRPLTINFTASSENGEINIAGRIEDDRLDFGGAILPRP